DWVQVRYFDGSSTPNPCVSFTVTVTGATEEENRDTAVAVATALVIREQPDGSGEGDETDEADGPPATIPAPDAPGEDLRLSDRETPMFWAMEAIEVDGSVERPAVTPMGGSDGSGGPIVIVVTGEGRGLTLRGCAEVELVVTER